MSIVSPRCALDHGRAFDVPAGSAPTPRRIPANHTLAARLPQHEVRRVALVGRDLDTRARNHRIAVAPAEHAIVGVARDGEEHVTLRLIGMAVIDQPLDHRDHGRISRVACGAMSGGVTPRAPMSSR